MRTVMLAWCGILFLSGVLLGQTPTVAAQPNTVYVSADGRFETAPIRH